MLCSYKEERERKNERERERRKLEAVAYVYYIDSIDDVTGVYIFANFSNCTH